jgi:hypothetical protein
MIYDGQGTAEIVEDFAATGPDDSAFLDTSTIRKIEAALGVIAAWALLPGFLDEQTIGPKPKTPGEERAAKRKLREADVWAVSMVLSRAAPEALSLIKLAKYIADDDENERRAARQSLRDRLLPAMRDYGLIRYVMNGNECTTNGSPRVSYKISATERLLLFVKKHYLPALRHDGWMHYFSPDGVGDEHEKS